jgi:hypothetical protein
MPAISSRLSLESFTRDRRSAPLIRVPRHRVQRLATKTTLADALALALASAGEATSRFSHQFKEVLNVLSSSRH